MQISSVLATLLLAAPALVAAAPVAAASAGVTLVDSNVDSVFARYEATCNPVYSSDAKEKEKQEQSYKRMKDLTKEYKAAEKKCPSNALTVFAKKGDKAKKEKLKADCIKGYAECASKREAANKACVAAGGKSDAGHKQAVTFCKNKAAEWRAKKVT